MRRVLSLLIVVACLPVFAQDINEKINQKMRLLESDEQFRHASISLYVEEIGSGKIVYKKNEQLGLAPASCQKIVTSISAFEMLGPSFRYNTKMKINGRITDGKLNGDLVLEGSGDPTFGSWRYASTKEDIVLKNFEGALTAKGIRSISGKVLHNQDAWNQSIPDGWIWQDIGNYYGAGAFAFNWRENQYDVKMRTGTKVGDPVVVTGTEPILEGYTFKSELSSQNVSSGADTYIYLPIGDKQIILRGPAPLNQNAFSISGSIPDPGAQFAWKLGAKIKSKNIAALSPGQKNAELIFQHQSPAFDSINYWFLKRSVNLYGEAFVKTIAFIKNGKGSTAVGVELIRDFWKGKGISASALKIVDGSGLSPANRITTHALVRMLQFAKDRSWYKSFHNALPELNGIKMKDGYISGVRSYSGYIKSQSGVEYVFSFIINNFDGSAVTVREKMWKLLDLMK